MEDKTFREACRKNRIKVTPQRLAIYGELAKAKDHPSTDRIFQKIKRLYPRISFDTVNRTVLTLVDVGLVRIVEGGNGRLFDPNLEDHHHLRCVKCHSVVDFFHKAYDELEVPKKLPGRFSVLGKKVVLEGVCEKCQSKKGGKSS